jgi:hypothetical protein
VVGHVWGGAVRQKIGDEDVTDARVKTPEVGEGAGELAGSDDAECEQDDAPSVGGVTCGLACGPVECRWPGAVHFS